MRIFCAHALLFPKEMIYCLHYREERERCPLAPQESCALVEARRGQGQPLARERTEESAEASVIAQMSGLSPGKGKQSGTAKQAVSSLQSAEAEAAFLHI